ncbi:MAG: DUF3990 domain-containing protein [Acidobacteriota bacterium]|nr:DUF3990 domain-containing protein [Acidobacteriota bacterium]
MKHLYHGSNMGFDAIDLGKCHRFKDFGQGIYLTELEQQAQEWATRVVERNGVGVPTVLVFELDERKLADVSTLIFDTPCADWAHFVINNRNRKWHDDDDPLSNHDAKYDVVEGPVANDDIATTFALFVRGILDDGQLIQQLAYKKLNHQISFHTERALTLLCKVDCYELDRGTARKKP